jgi:hypothetical protein
LSNGVTLSLNAPGATAVTNAATFAAVLRTHVARHGVPSLYRRRVRTVSKRLLRVISKSGCKL